MEKIHIKKDYLLIICILTGIMLLTGCGRDPDEIYVVSREEGSGTRGAFTEVAGVTDENGYDITTRTAEVTNSTAVMMQTVAGNRSAIGYVSLGSLSDQVKTVKVDGVPVTVENVKNGEYGIARSFNIVTKGGLTSLASDFKEYILSDEGQKIVSEEGYISMDDVYKYEKKHSLNGKITLAGSTSVAPVLEVIAESYMKLYPDVSVEIQQSGSSAGIVAVAEGVSDIGLSSRSLTHVEREEGLVETEIAMDGIGIVINPENPADNLTGRQIREIFSGQERFWSGL